MLDDTSLLAPAICKKRRRIMPSSISGQETIRAGFCDMRLDPGGRGLLAYFRPVVPMLVRLYLVQHSCVPPRASSLMPYYRPPGSRGR